MLSWEILAMLHITYNLHPSTFNLPLAVWSVKVKSPANVSHCKEEEFFKRYAHDDHYRCPCKEIRCL